MRKRKIIETDGKAVGLSVTHQLQLEVLLDIRDALVKATKKKK